MTAYNEPLGGKRLYLCQDPALIQAQLAGQALSLAQAGRLRDDISTDEITPAAILSYYDERLGEFAHTGLSCGGQLPIGRRALKHAGITVLVGGRRYGKGSSREHSPAAEKLAGVRIVFAESFERIYRQNADNIGLLTSTDFSLLQKLEAGQALSLEEVVADRDPLAAAVLRAGGLLRWGQRHLMASAQSRAVAPPAGPRTLFEKIAVRHLIGTTLTASDPQVGEGVFVRADWRFIHEYYTGMADTLLRAAVGEGFSIVQPEQVLVFEDHSSYVDESPAHIRGALVTNMLAMTQAQRDFVARHRLRFHRTLTDAQAALEPSQTSDRGDAAGISHAMMSEHYVLPGQVVVGTDSHTPHSGALGCLAFGVGTTDMANAFITGVVRLTWPASIRVNLEGAWPEGVTAKDAVLHLLASPFIREGGGVGKVFEFDGEAISALSIDERATLTNMTAELGGLTGIVAPDARTVHYLRERRGVDFILEDWMRSDAGASYAQILHLDVSTLSPMVARPGDPGNGMALSALQAPVRIDIAYGGSCTAGKREDFDHYHRVLAWALEQGLRFPAHVQVYLQYGTTAVRDYCMARGYHRSFEALGVRILQPSCGACANCGPGSSERADQVTVSAINRNFPGRSGPGQVWLASPPTVMASALAGELISFEQLRARTLKASRATRLPSS